MRSPTSSEDWSELLCRVHKRGCQGLGAIEMHSRARTSGASAARFDRPARQATEPRARREAMYVCSLSGSGGRFDVRAE